MNELPAAPLLLYLASGADVQRLAVGPALAAAADRAGWGFDCYYDALRRGRHHGGGDPDTTPDEGAAAGALVVGGDHANRALRVCARYAVAALGDPGSPPWPPLDSAAVRALVGRTVRATGLDAFLEERRPYDGWRPGGVDDGIVAAVRDAGFSYMWSKSGFGEPRVIRRNRGFVVLPFTAGSWDGWSPFYTIGDRRALLRAERRLLARRKPGWLATTIDSPLFALPGEVWEHGARLHEIAAAVAQGGGSGELVNVTPHVVARYARLLADRDPTGGRA